MSDVVWLYGEMFLLIAVAFLAGALVTAGLLRIVLPTREQALSGTDGVVEAGDGS